MFNKGAVIGLFFASQCLWAQSSGFTFEKEYLPEQRPAPVVVNPAPAVVIPAPAVVIAAPTVAPVLPIVRPTASPTAPTAPLPAPAAPTAMEQFTCKSGSTNSTAMASQLFKEVLGIQGMRPGYSLIEGEPFTGTQVRIKIMNSENIKLRLVSHGADVAGKACWQKIGNRKQIILSVVVSNAAIGNGAYTITVTREGDESVYLRGSGGLAQVLDHQFDVTSAQSAR